MASLRLGINGFGRIGRLVLRASVERDNVDVVAINDLLDVEHLAYMLEYDSVHGRYQGSVEVDGSDLIIDGDRMRVLAERDPAKLPWAELGVDVVYECTGLFRSKETAGAHITAGAKKVIVSAPGQEVDNTIVYGVNDADLKPTDTVISNASCTTNCLAPVAKVLHEAVGIENGLMTTIHAYTNDQVLTDVFHKDLRRARSATMSQIPTKTGAAAAVDPDRQPA